MSQETQDSPNPFTVIGNAKTAVANAILSVRELKQNIALDAYTLLAMNFVANVQELIDPMLSELGINDEEEITNGK